MIKQIRCDKIISGFTSWMERRYFGERRKNDNYKYVHDI